MFECKWALYTRSHRECCTWDILDIYDDPTDADKEKQRRVNEQLGPRDAEYMIIELPNITYK